MKHYTYADVRYNNGNGALLCSVCRIIISYGFEHEDKEHVCESCEKRNKELLRSRYKFIGIK